MKLSSEYEPETLSTATVIVSSVMVSEPLTKLNPLPIRSMLPELPGWCGQGLAANLVGNTKLRTDSKKALLFEKRSKNFCPFSVRVGATLAPYRQEFFGSFLQKRTACFLLLAASTGRLG
jgi:hypothetical protein